jgi:hypothetical protein
MPEISELYKDDPNFFKSLREKLVEKLPDKFPIEYVKDIFDKDKLMATIDEIKKKNITIDEYKKKQKEDIEIIIKEKEEEEKEKQNQNQIKADDEFVDEIEKVTKAIRNKVEKINKNQINTEKNDQIRKNNNK